MGYTSSEEDGIDPPEKLKQRKKKDPKKLKKIVKAKSSSEWSGSESESDLSFVVSDSLSENDCQTISPKNIPSKSGKKSSKSNKTTVRSKIAVPVVKKFATKSAQ